MQGNLPQCLEVQYYTTRRWGPRIGEDPNGMPNNLAPFISQVAIGRRACLNVFGDDYETRDGTGERDYIHVEDLARAHMAAFEFAAKKTGCEAINVGTGKGTTVLEMVAAFEKTSGKKIPYKICPRRDGDVAWSIAAVDKARLGVDEMSQSSWLWQSGNPEGYGD